MQHWFDNDGGSEWGETPPTAYAAFAEANQVQAWFEGGGHLFGEEPSAALAAYVHDAEGTGLLRDAGWLDPAQLNAWFDHGTGAEYGADPSAALEARRAAAAAHVARGVGRRSAGRPAGSMPRRASSSTGTTTTATRK
jgi:hypothetical protein